MQQPDEQGQETRTSKFRQETLVLRIFTATVLLLAFLIADGTPEAVAQSANRRAIAVVPQYDTTRVYVAQGELDAFVNSFIVTFRGSNPRSGGHDKEFRS